MRMGLREANQRFSRAVRAVKAGQQVVLTERGKPIAVLTALPEASPPEVAVRRLESAGLLRGATRAGPLPPWRPRPLTGESLSKTLREERDAC